jgi:hypothetical protein
MSFFDYVKHGWEVVKLKVEVMDKLAADEKAFGPAIGIVAIAGACYAIGSFTLPGIIYFPILSIIEVFIFTGIIHFAATSFFGGKGEFKQVFTPIACSLMVVWVAIIPVIGPLFLGFLAGIWVLVVSVVVVERTYKLDRGKAIVTVAIPVVVGLILSAMLAAFGVAVWALLGR